MDVLGFFISISRFDLNFESVKPTISTSIPTVVLPMLQHELECVAQASQADDAFDRSPSSSKLSEPILMQYLLRSLHLLTDSEVFSLLSTTELLQTLTYSIRQICRKGHETSSLRLRIFTLQCLTRIGGCQCLNAAVDQSHLTDLIKVLVEYLATRATDLLIGTVRDDHGVFAAAVGAVRAFAEAFVRSGGGRE